MRDLASQERIEVPGMPMMDLRKDMQTYRLRWLFTLCCQRHKHVYAQIEVGDMEWGFNESRAVVYRRLFDIARRDMGWMWHIRERFADLVVGDAGSAPFAEEDRPLALSVDERAIGWPHASAHKTPRRIDEIDCVLGVGSSGPKFMTLNKWCGLSSALNAKQILAGQAFVACVRQSLSGVLERNKDNEGVKAALAQMRRAQGRIVEDVWRMPVYEVVEALCGLRAAGVEVFHADEEMTWDMFLSGR